MAIDEQCELHSIDFPNHGDHKLEGGMINDAGKHKLHIHYDSTKVSY